MNNAYYINILVHLRTLAELGQVPDPEWGICTNANMLADYNNLVDFGVISMRACVNDPATDANYHTFPIEGNRDAYYDNATKWEGEWLTKRLTHIERMIAYLKNSEELPV